jgi:hypothetical protein
METIREMLAALSPADQRLVLDGIRGAAEHLHLAARTLTDARYHEDPLRDWVVHLIAARDARESAVQVIAARFPDPAGWAALERAARAQFELIHQRADLRSESE